MSDTNQPIFISRALTLEIKDIALIEITNSGEYYKFVLKNGLTYLKRVECAIIFKKPTELFCN